MASGPPFANSTMATDDTAPATAQNVAPRRPRVSPVKALLVVLFLAALTPFWVLYGLVGSLLSASSTRLSQRGVAVLVGTAVAIVAEIVYVEFHHRDMIRESLSSPATYTSLVAALGAVLGALVYAQWKLHELLMVVFDRAGEPQGSALSKLTEFVGPFFLLYAMWAPVSQWKHWELVTGLSIYLFFAVYFAVPVVVALAHAKFWVPASYAELARIERELLEKNLTCKFELLKVAGLGTVFVPCTSKTVASKAKKTLVLVHGYAAGNALWACNFEFLAQYYDVYAIEWVGKGRSDRPDFTSYEHADADTIFVDGIEKWRKAMKLEKFYLAGHSLGAMFVSSYAVRYPGRAEHLVLISPAGVGHPPPPAPVTFGLRVFRYLWSLKLTPMSVARYAGPFGPALIRFIARTRIGVMPETSAMRRGQLPLDVVGDYWYHNWALKASGEVAMHTHLHPGVFAKKPICEILTPKTIHVPITFMYGGGPDWMEPRHAHEFAKKFHGNQRARVQVLLVPLAGHQVFTDNVDDFNMMLHQVLEGEHKQ